MVDRRLDQHSAKIIDEALKIQRAFDFRAAVTFLKTNGISDEITSLVLSSRYDRRVNFRRTRSRVIAVTSKIEK